MNMYAQHWFLSWLMKILGAVGGKKTVNSSSLLDVVLFTVVFLLPTMLHLAFPPVLLVYNSPWYNGPDWLGIKKQVTYLCVQF